MTESNQVAQSTESTTAQATTEGQANQQVASGQSNESPASSESPAQQPLVAADGKVDLNALLGEDLAKNKTFEKFKEGGVKELGKAYIEQEKRMGELTSKIGSFKVPEKAEDYGFAKPENLPENIPYNEEDAKQWAEKFKEMGVPVEMANKIRNQFMSNFIEQHAKQGEQQAAEYDSANQRLDEIYTKEFGDKKTEMSERVLDVIKQVFKDPAQREDLAKTLPNEALLAIALIDKHYHAKYGMSDNTVDESDSSSTALTPEAARNKGREIMASEEYRNAMHPKHAEAVAEAKKQYALADTLTKAVGKR